MDAIGKETHGRPTVFTLRRLVALALGAVAVYVVVLALSVTLLFLPRITSLRADTQALITELEGYARASAQLDSAVAEARAALASGEVAVAQRTLREAHSRPSSPLSASGIRALVGAPLAMRNALANAAEGEFHLRDLIGEARAHLDLGDPARADSILAEGEDLAAGLVVELASAQQAGLQDVARRGLALEETVTQASRAFLAWAALGLVFVAVVSWLIHRRLYVPLRALDVGMRSLSEGALDTRLDVDRDDELGRLASVFNRTAEVLRARDVERRTERKEMTQKILDSTLDAVITIDPSGMVTGWNVGAETVFGWDGDEMLGKPLDRIIPESHLPLHQAGLRKYRLLTEGPLLHRRTVMPALRRDGSEFSAELSVVPIVEEGHKVAYTAFLRDVTEQRRAEEAVKKSEEILRGIVDNSSAIITMKDLHGRYRMVNRRFREIFGVASQDAVGKSVPELIPTKTAAEAVLHDQEALRRGRAMQFEEFLETPIGRRQYVTIRFPLLTDSGEAYGVASIATDVTESMELEERVRRSQRLEAVGRLAGGIAHDFNNLVTIILGQTQLALEEESSPDVRAGLREIEKAAERAGSLTSQLLAFARKQIIAPERTDVNALVKDTLGMVHRVLEATVSVRADLDPQAGQVNVDRGHFSQVLLNLIMNSRDAMPAEGGTVTIRTVSAAEGEVPEELPPGRYVVLTVTDDGPGISEEVLLRVFEPFYTTKVGGTGLGLATCHGIVNQAGGTIQAANAPEGGAQFSVWLPRLAADPGQADG